MSTTATPAEIFRRLVRAVGEHRQAEIVDEVYAEDVIVEHPFMVPEPTITKGREQLRKRMENLRNLPLTMEVSNIVVHETIDPELIVGEFESRVTSKQTGKQITTSNILVLKVHDGLIVSSRDYHNHALLADLIGPPRQP